MIKCSLNDEAFDELIRYAATRQLEKIADEVPTDEELAVKFTFSSNFEEKMQRLFLQQRKIERNARLRKVAIKIAAVILVILAVSTATVMTVDAWRVRVLNFISEINERSTTIYIDGGEVDYDRFLTEVREMYLPTYLPGEYTAESIEKVGSYYLVTYTNNMGNVFLVQSLPSGFSVGIDSENAITEQILVNGELAQYFLKNNIGNLMFKYEENAFLISGPLVKDELIKIAESMKYWE